MVIRIRFAVDQEVVADSSSAYHQTGHYKR